MICLVNKHLTLLTYWSLGDLIDILVIFKSTLMIDGWAISCDIALGWILRDLILCKSTLDKVLAITWANIHVDLCRHKAALGHNGLINKHWIFVHIAPSFPALVLAISMGCVLGDRIRTETVPKEPMFIKYVKSNHNSV